MARSFDSEGERPLAVGLERVADTVKAVPERLGGAAALHFRHLPHGRHVVLKGQVGALDRLA
jgi:hypothetical protein